MKTEYKCLQCGAPLHGRPDKKFCSPLCKDRWNNSRRKDERDKKSRVLGVLQNNYSILSSLEESQGNEWNTELLETIGFRPDFFTRLVRRSPGEMLCECFDIRYRISKRKLYDIEPSNTPSKS